MSFPIQIDKNPSIKEVPTTLVFGDAEHDPNQIELPAKEGFKVLAKTNLYRGKPILAVKWRGGTKSFLYLKRHDCGYYLNNASDTNIFTVIVHQPESPKEHRPMTPKQQVSYLSSCIKHYIECESCGDQACSDKSGPDFAINLRKEGWRFVITDCVFRGGAYCPKCVNDK